MKNDRQVIAVEVYQHPLEPDLVRVETWMRGADARAWSCTMRVPGTLETAPEHLLRGAMEAGIKACLLKVPRLTPPDKDVLNGFKRWVARSVLGPRHFGG